jgi:hypothetical protein
MSLRLSGPIKPEFAFDGESETSDLRIRGNVEEDFAERDRRRVGELVQVRIVVAARFVLGDADLPHHLVLLHALDDDRLLEIAAQIGHRHVLGLQRRLELLLGLDLVFLLDVLDDALELIVADAVAELLAALQQQHLVDDVDDQLRRDLVERLAKLGVGRRALQVDLLPLLAQDADLTLLELALREDLAVHLDEDLLEDFGAADGAGGEQERGQQSCLGFHKSFET